MRFPLLKRNNNNNNNNNNNKVEMEFPKRKPSSSSSSNTIFKILIIIVLTIYWLLLLKLGHRGIPKNVLEALSMNTSIDTNTTQSINQSNNNNNNMLLQARNHEQLLLLQQQQQQLQQRTRRQARISLEDLVYTNSNPICNPGNSKKRLVEPILFSNDNNSSSSSIIHHNNNNNTNINNNNNNNKNKIPKILHFTAKTRCMTPHFIQNIEKWTQMNGYTIYIHDDAAVERLFQQDWPEFPQLHLLLNIQRGSSTSTSTSTSSYDNNNKMDTTTTTIDMINNNSNNNSSKLGNYGCLQKGASAADLWRYLVLWEYGGIYADMDSAPGPKLLERNNNENNNNNNDDAFFVVERIGIMSQYFMSGAPKHPYFHLCVTICLERLFNIVNKVGKQNVPVITGPGVVKVAMVQFMQNVDATKTKKYSRISQGLYTGVAGRSIRVVGSKATGSKDWVIRESMKKHKQNGYAAMGMKHFSQIKLKGMNISCHEHLYNQYQNFIQ